MSKITNDGLTRSGTGCFIAVPSHGNSGRQRAKFELFRKGTRTESAWIFLSFNVVYAYCKTKTLQR